MTQAITAQPGTLTGAKVLLILGGFFGAVMAVNFLMAYDAISTFRGEVAEHPYEAGLAFNKEIAAAQAQAQRGWKVDVTLAAPLSARFRDARGEPLDGLDVTGVFAAPADKRRDVSFVLHETESGVYSADVAIPSGVSDFELQAARAGEVLFRTHNRIARP